MVACVASVGMSRNVWMFVICPVPSKLTASVTTPAASVEAGYGMSLAVTTSGAVKFCEWFAGAGAAIPTTSTNARNGHARILRVSLMGEICLSTSFLSRSRFCGRAVVREAQPAEGNQPVMRLELSELTLDSRENPRHSQLRTGCSRLFRPTRRWRQQLQPVFARAVLGRTG